MRKVAVGSQNPVKIEAAKRAFKKVFGNCEVFGTLVSSGVPDMPMSFEEAVRGAKNRAKRALGKLGTDFGVGFEGGLEQTSMGTFLCGFVAVVDKKGRWGFGKGSGLFLPKSVVEKVKEGKELGDVMDKIGGVKNTKQHEGATGFFTRGLIPRTQSFEHTLIYALSRFMREEIFESD